MNETRIDVERAMIAHFMELFVAAQRYLTSLDHDDPTVEDDLQHLRSALAAVSEMSIR